MAAQIHNGHGSAATSSGVGCPHMEVGLKSEPNPGAPTSHTNVRLPWVYTGDCDDSTQGTCEPTTGIPTAEADRSSARSSRLCGHSHTKVGLKSEQI